MTFSPKAIEAAARALCVQSGDDPDKLTYAHAMQCTGHDREPKFTWQYWMPFAEAALSAALAVDGMALVPLEPTAKMIDEATGIAAGDGVPDEGYDEDIRRIWLGMLAAASNGDKRQ
jgi:hypothetical protein